MFKTFLLLLLVSVLSFFSMGESFCEKPYYPESVSDDNAENNEFSYLQGGQVKFQFLHKTSEIVVGSVNTIPARVSKYYTFGFSGISPSLEQRLQNISAQYLVRSEGINLSLATGDIIFPFQYFW